MVENLCAGVQLPAACAAVAKPTSDAVAQNTARRFNDGFMVYPRVADTVVSAFEGESIDALPNRVPS
jgi:hypothetical protein